MDRSVTVMNLIFDRFEEEGIRYCHFKSNQHIDESFEGRSDFDILADRDRQSAVTEILISFGARRFESPVLNNYPGIQNWLIFDDKSGIIYHMHLHYQLLTGTVHVKQYKLSWFPMLLDNTYIDQDHGIRMPIPECEMILLLSRIILKTNIDKRIRYTLAGFKMSEAYKKEFDYLLERLDQKIFKEKCSRIYPAEAAEQMSDIINAGKMETGAFRRLNHMLRRYYKESERCGEFSAIIRALKCEAEYSRNKREKRVRKKVGEKGGISVAFVGVDGSGKSTTVDNIYKWLSKKIETEKIYLGTGDGADSPKVRFLKTILRFGGKLSPKKRTSEHTESAKDTADKRKLSLTHKPVRFIIKSIEAEIISTVAHNNKIKLINMNRYRMDGGISVIDRFPQLESENINDGIKLKKYAAQMAGSRIRRLAAKEIKDLKITEKIYPDVIFRLNISLKTCMERKASHTDEEYFRTKIESLKGLSYPMTRVIEIDAEQDYENELLTIKKEIWKLL